MRHLYETARGRAARKEMHWPDFDDFWEQGYLELPAVAEARVSFEDFRRDLERYRLSTASGRIEIFSSKIASFGYADCLGHPAWFEPAEWLGSAKQHSYPLHLLTTQPATRLHGQMDMGRVSQQSKVAGREPIRISPTAAARRSIGDGDVVRVYNERGAILALEQRSATTCDRAWCRFRPAHGTTPRSREHLAAWTSMAILMC